MNKDLTTGEPRKVLWQFCLPLFGSVIFQQLYNLADSFVAGKFIGENALAAVGNSYEITLIYIAFAFGCNIACSVITSRCFGARDYNRMKTVISTAMISCAMICAILMSVGLLGGMTLLKMIRTPETLLPDSDIYLRIYTLGLPFIFYYNLSTGIFSALGDSVTPFRFLAVSSIMNIAVDILFVRVFNMGIAGTAWATFLCQGISCILAVIVVCRRLGKMPHSGRVSIFSMSDFRELSAVAVPSILQQSFISIGNILIQSVINGFGAGAIAGYAAGVKLNNLVITSFTTIGNGISNYTSQNIGAGRFDRIRKGFRAGLIMIWWICLVPAALYFFLPDALLRIFLDTPSADALHAGTLYLRILAPFYFVVASKLVADGILRGASKMRPFAISTFTDLILRVVLAMVLSATALGITGVWCAWPVGWSIATVMSVYFCTRCIHGFEKLS